MWIDPRPASFTLAELEAWEPKRSSHERAAWLLHVASVVGRSTVSAEQHEELRQEAVHLRGELRALQLALVSALGLSAERVCSELVLAAHAEPTSRSDARSEACISPTGRTDCHNRYLQRNRDGIMACSFCKQPIASEQPHTDRDEGKAAGERKPRVVKAPRRKG